MIAFEKDDPMCPEIRLTGGQERSLSNLLNFILKPRFLNDSMGISIKKILQIGIGCFIGFPAIFFALMYRLRCTPQTRSMFLHENVKHMNFGSQRRNGESIIFVHGFKNNAAFLTHTIINYFGTENGIYVQAPLFSDARTNLKFDMSWGQTYDCLQLLDFLISIDFVNNKSIVGIVCHSLGGARFLTLYDVLKTKDPDFLGKAGLSEEEAEQMFERLKSIRKCLVAPLLDLKEVFIFQMKRQHIPFSEKLSDLILRYCMPFITDYKFDPFFQSPKQRLQNWSKDDFKGFHFIYVQHDNEVGNGDVEWLCKKMDVVKNSEISNKSVTVLPYDPYSNESPHDRSDMLGKAAAFAQWGDPYVIFG